MIRRVLAGATLVYVLASVALGCASAVANHRPSDIVVFPAVLAFALAGWLLTVRLSRNNVGPLLLMTSFGLSLQPWGEITLWMWRHHVAGAALIATVSQSSFVFDVGGLALLLPLHFPDGRLPSRHWFWRLVLAADIGYMVSASANVLVPAPVDLPSGARVPNLLAVHFDVNPIIAACVPMLVLGIAGSFAAVTVRWRSADPERRAQIKWVAGVLVVAPIPFVLHDSVTSLSDVLLTCLLPLVPLAMAVAVLRYRLYDIDRVVSRTVTYLVVTGLLVGVYVGLVAFTTSLLSLGSSLGVAASTLAAAALFQPVRRRVQAAVDRRFNRARYDAARTVEAFASRLRDEVEVAAVRDDLLSVAAGAIQPAHLSLWVAS